jgi:hypothetical protein
MVVQAEAAKLPKYVAFKHQYVMCVPIMMRRPLDFLFVLSAFSQQENTA